MPRHTEPIANSALGGILARMLPSFDVRSENTRQIVGQPNLRPDILIIPPGRSPVAVEAEFMPAYAAEDEARERLGLQVVRTGSRAIDAAIALRYPEDVADADDLHAAVRDASLSYAVLYDDGARFPKSGWLSGGVEELSDLIRLVSVPQRVIEEAAAAIERGIEIAAEIMEELGSYQPNAVTGVAALLGMSHDTQTYRMAGAIVANAMIFHERLASQVGVASLSTICGETALTPKTDVLAAWDAILRINYWTIFAFARDIIHRLPYAEAARLLRRLREMVEKVDAAGADQAQNIIGRIFQRLIVERKFLATFYTLPTSASLLARLAVARLSADWSDADAVSALRIGDFACGTGALLSSVYERVAVLHERAGGDPAAIHPAMMEDVLYGCDVMPSAIHITGATLSGAQPAVWFDKSRLYNLSYGRQEDGDVRLGSLELLQSSAAMTLFNTSDPAMRTGSLGEETAAQITADVPDAGFDLVIMNPPFTRNVTREGDTANAVAAAFAAFNATDDDQRAMTRRMATLKEGTCYHGNAGVASAFAALADRKLKPGGVLALVLPLSAASGSAWTAFRKMIADNYTDLTVVSIAANGADTAFSSDTGMAECLVVARKRAADSAKSGRANFVSLRRRPRGFAESEAAAQSIIAQNGVRRIEDGPYGGRQLSVGDDTIGESIDAPQADGSEWGAVRLLDASIAQTAHALTQSKLWLPAEPAPLDIKIAPLREVGKMGTYHLDIIGRPPRGPFTKDGPSATATYPSLWNHNARNETRMVCAPDSQLRARIGVEEKANAVWQTASRAHLNSEFTFGSQPLAVAFTESVSLGGTVWPNVIFDDERFDYAFAIWANSTLGLLSYWWRSSRQQSSKARMTIRAAEALPILDLRALMDEQLAEAERVFDEFRALDLKPAYLADADPNRALLDRRLTRDVLGMDERTYAAIRRLCAKWCAEPSVHGGKRRPRGAEFVA